MTNSDAMRGKYLYFFSVFLLSVCWADTGVSQSEIPWGWNRPYMPYQTRPPYPGALPLYYDRNIPVYDYTGAGQFQVPIVPQRNMRNRPDTTRPRKRVVGDFDNDGAPDRNKPHFVKAVPKDAEIRKADGGQATVERAAKRAKAEFRTWKTNKGVVIEDAHIVAFVDGQVLLKTEDGHRYYVTQTELDDESRQALKEWRQRK